MGIFRWFLTISFIGIAFMLALLLGFLLLGVYLLMRFTGALRTVTVRVDESGRVVMPQPERDQPRRVRSLDSDLPRAPAGVDVRHMRTWDAEQNRAIDRWYYKDEGGQWIFVQPPAAP